jgi:hypothetical protein
MHIAERSLYLLIARMAWACEIRKMRTDDGEEVDVPWYDYTAGFNVQPKPFRFELVARSEERGYMVERTWMEGKAGIR